MEEPIWIGLYGYTWVTGGSLINIYGVYVQINYWDSAYERDWEYGCSMTDFRTWIMDQSCNLRPNRSFLCEII
jgi:hypothetical protein